MTAPGDREQMISAMARAMSDQSWLYGWESVTTAERRAWRKRAKRVYEQVVAPQLDDLRGRAQIGPPNARHVVVQAHVLQELQRTCQLALQHLAYARRSVDTSEMEAERLQVSLARIAATLSDGEGSEDV